MKRLPSSRTLNILVVAGAIFLMATALFFQHVMGLEPCILCVAQRVVVIGIGLIALIAAIHSPRFTGIRVYGGAVLLCAIGGIYIAGRQVWLQSLPPDQVPACGPSLEYLLEVFPLQEVLAKVFLGDGDCAKVLWTFLGISIPGWTLVAFTGFALIGGCQIAKPRV